MLLTSNLAIILWRELATSEPVWWPLVHLSGLLIIFLTTAAITQFRPLRAFVVVLLIIFIFGYGAGWNWGLVPFIRGSTAWNTWISNVPLATSELATHLLRLTPAFVILAFLLLIGLRRPNFFLVKGDIHAPVEPSRLLGMKEPEPWTRTGSIFAVIFTVFTLVFLLASSGFPASLSAEFLTLIPVVLAVAAMNAFNEEFTLRAAPLSILWKEIGKEQALLITTVYFGLGHFYGVPNGIIGVLLAGFLGWFLGKSLLETKGFFWAWFIHFLTDVVIFSFMILGAA
jgi:hypothetical protein